MPIFVYEIDPVPGMEDFLLKWVFIYTFKLIFQVGLYMYVVGALSLIEVFFFSGDITFFSSIAHKAALLLAGLIILH